LQTQPFVDSRDAIEYFVSINGKRHFIRLPYYAIQWQIDDTFFKENKNLLEALLLNNKWFQDEATYITIDELKKLIATVDIPRTPQQKLENLFLHLFSLQKEDGQRLS